jgi:hypothetical protein
MIDTIYWPLIWILAGFSGMGIAYLITTKFFTKDPYEKIKERLDESFNMVEKELHAEPKLQSKMNEPFVNWSDIQAWAIRGKHIEQALDKQGMDYVVHENKKVTAI